MYDTQEIFFALRNNRYNDSFIYYAIMFLNKQNLVKSMSSLEHKYFEAMITLFKFVSTLGLTGQAFSSTYYQFSLINPAIYTGSLESIFDNDKEKFLANPNFKITFDYGFPDFFTKVNKGDDIDKKIIQATDFLQNVSTTVWEAIC